MTTTMLDKNNRNIQSLEASLPRSTKEKLEKPSSTIQQEVSQKISSDTSPREAHFILQGKGGVGKSFVASLMTQYLDSKGRSVVAVDTDPVNATLFGYKQFGTRRLELLRNGEVDTRNFDSLIESIISEDSDFVIDNGAASFIPLSYYVQENDAFNIIAEHGKTVIIHTVVTGGQALADTMGGLKSLLTQMPEHTQIVVWINEFFGAVELNGKTFEESKIYQEYKDRIYGIVKIASQTGSTFGIDVKLMLDSKLTFKDVSESASFGLMAKSRLARVKDALFSQLETLF